jgi:hypothetical protein
MHDTAPCSYDSIQPLLVNTNYLYDGMSLVEEVDANGNLIARYTQGRDVDERLAEQRSGTTSYYQQDALDSVTSLSSSTGTLSNTYTYDAFGNSFARVRDLRPLQERKSLNTLKPTGKKPSYLEPRAKKPGAKY